jgi:succinate dehydrogenase/fumarate reductase flavoprotein subunit
MSYQAEFGREPVAWPYPVHYEGVRHVSVDTVVVGGGLAGCCAGIEAARRGAKVAVVDKAPIKRSGCGGAGMDHWNTVLDYPGSPMSAEENLMKGSTAGRQGHRDYIAVKGTWKALLELERLGLPVRDADGDFEGAPTRDEKTGLLKAYDYRELVAVKLRGGQFIKPILYDGLRREPNVTLFERVMVTNLLTEGGRQGAPVVGATGFSLETGEFYVFHAKAVILTCGYACTIWTYSTEITGNSWRWDPNEIGEGLAMAWQAGAEIFGMHKNGHTRASHPFAWPRFGVGNPSNTWFPCTIVDNNGREIPWEDKNGKLLTSVEARSLPTADQAYCGSTISDNLKSAALPNLVHDLPDRIRRGEFELPFWADLPDMPEAERRSIWGMMVGNEGKTRFTLYDLYTRAGFNPDRDMLMAPVMAPEGYKSGGWFQGEPNAVKPWRSESFGCQGEPAVDWDLMTSVPGLFAAGAASGLEGCSFACSSGFYVGDRAAEYAARTPAGKIDDGQLAAEHTRVYAPVRRWGDREAYISWKELWGGSARAMQQCCADNKTIPVLEQGLRWIDSIRRTELQQTYARNPHELARVLEDETRLTVSEMFLDACIVKIHTDADREHVPDGTYVFNRLDGARVKTTYRPDRYWLGGENEDDYLGNYQKHTAAGKER